MLMPGVHTFTKNWALVIWFLRTDVNSSSEEAFFQLMFYIEQKTEAEL